MCIRDRYNMWGDVTYNNNINERIMRYFTNVHDLGDLKSALAEAFEIKKDRYKYETLGKHKTCPVSYTHLDVYKRQALKQTPGYESSGGK